MTELISEARPRARKDRNCMASDWIVNGGLPNSITFAECRQLVAARRNKWRIKAGDVYLRQAVKCCGDFGIFNAIPAVHAICIKYDLYDHC